MRSVRELFRKTWLWAFLRILYKNYLTGRELKAIARNQSLKKARRLLAINHFFHGELKAFQRVQAQFPDVALLPLLPEPFFTPVVYLFPEALRSQFFSYEHADFSRLREKSRALSETVFDKIYAAYPFDCVITPSDLFYWIREFILICQRRGIPVIVLDKEGTISPLDYQVLPQKIERSFPVISDRVYVWSERKKQFWKNAGIAEDKILVSGSVRTDLFVHVKMRAKNNVIFFDFAENAYIDSIDWSEKSWEGEKSWKKLRQSVRQTALKIAKKHPHLEVIIKCHPQQCDMAFDDLEWRDCPNVTIKTGAEISELLEKTYAVVGFQTTALLESSLANIPTFYSAWGNLFDFLKNELLPWHEWGFGIHWCHDQDRLFECVHNAIEGRVNESEKDKSRISEYFFNSDGNRAAFVLQSLLSERIEANTK